MKKNKIFSFLSRRIDERKAVNQTVSVSGENMKQKESDFMENENIKPVVDNNETKPTSEEQVDKTLENQNKDEKQIPQSEDNQQVVDETPNQVQDTTPSGNGIPLEQVATKDFVKELLDSFSAKFEAMVNENKALKEELAESKGKVTEMQNRYENKDFGGFEKKGVQTKDKVANDTFDEYSKQFM